MVQGCYLGVKFKFASGRMLCDIVFPTNNILGAAQSNALDPNVIMHFIQSNQIPNPLIALGVLY